MKKYLTSVPLSLLAIGLPLAVLVATLGETPAGRHTVEAAPASVAVVEQRCLGGNQAIVVLTWTPASETAQWVDFSTSDDFQSEDAVNVGPLAPTQTSYTWDGGITGVTYYARVNRHTPAGTSPTITFQTPRNCQFVSEVSAARCEYPCIEFEVMP